MRTALLLVALFGTVAAAAQPVTIAMPAARPSRDQHTTLLAHFERSADADYARTFRQNVGRGTPVTAEGIRIADADHIVIYEGLDNLQPEHFTVEFRAKLPIWRDHRAHWLFAVYPERGQFEPAGGMAPYHIGLFKSADDTLVLSVVQKPLAFYELGSALSQPTAWSVRVDAASMANQSTHHILFSVSLEPPGRLLLAVDRKGSAKTLDLPPTAPRPAPAQKILFGGVPTPPRADLEAAQHVLDELRIEDLAYDELQHASIASERLPQVLEAQDAARASLDRFLQLQRHGGWHDFYQWPTYEPAEWGWIGRGVNLWFVTNRQAGELLLRAWRLWGDDRYLEAAYELAEMYEKTQLPNGGWNFHYALVRGVLVPHSQKAMIAQEMQSNPIRFLAFFAALTKDARALAALRESVGFYVGSQGAGGWWGWRPTTGAPSGPPALNDAVTSQAIEDLLVLYAVTGDARCLDAMRRAAEWILRVQLPAPTFGWAEAYSEADEKPAWNRDFEPPAVSMEAISSAARVLFMMYDVTGDARYLRPLRQTAAWLKSVPEAQRGWVWYDLDTQKPIVGWKQKIYTVDDPLAKSEILEALRGYGLHYQWPQEMIEAGLAARDAAGRLYPADAEQLTPARVNGAWVPRGANQSRNWLPRASFAGSTSSRSASPFPADAVKSLRAWLGGATSAVIPDAETYYDSYLIVNGRYEGRQFQPMEALRLTGQLLDWIERTEKNGGDASVPPQPRYDPHFWGAWTYAYPDRDLYDIPLAR